MYIFNHPLQKPSLKGSCNTFWSNHQKALLKEFIASPINSSRKFLESFKHEWSCKDFAHSLLSYQWGLEATCWGGDNKKARSIAPLSAYIMYSEYCIFFMYSLLSLWLWALMWLHGHRMLLVAPSTMQLTMLNSANGRRLRVHDTFIWVYGLICWEKSECRGFWEMIVNFRLLAAL